MAPTSSASASSSTSATGSGLSPTQLSSALVTVDDLGSPFVKEPGSGSGGGGTTSSSGCPALDALVSSGGAGTGGGDASRQAEFNGGNSPVFLAEYLDTADSPTVTAGFTQLRSALQSCTSWTLKDSSAGSDLNFALSPISFGGSDSTSVRLDGQINGVELNGYLAFDDLGSVLLGYVYFQGGSGSSQLAYILYQKAVTKAEQVLGVQPVTSN